MCIESSNSLISSFGAAGAGALLGAVSAYLLGRHKQKEDKKNADHAAIHQAHYAISSQWNILKGIQKGLLDPHRDENLRFLYAKEYYSFGSPIRVNYDGLSFLAVSDEPNLLNQIHLAEQAFDTAIGALELRNKKIEEFYNAPDVKILEFDFETGFNNVEATPQRMYFIKRSTDVLYDSVDRAIPKLLSEAQAIRTFSERIFKGKTTLKMEEIKK